MVRASTNVISVNLNPFAHVKKDYANPFMQERISISADQILQENQDAVSQIFNQIHSEMYKTISKAHTWNENQRNLVVKNFKNYFSALEELAQGIHSRTFDLSLNQFKYFVHLDNIHDFKSVGIRNKKNQLIYQVVLEGYDDNNYQLTVVNVKSVTRVTIKGNAWDDDLWWLHNASPPNEYN